MNVVKIGGSSLATGTLVRFLARCEGPTVVVHGGGPQISNTLQALGHAATFHRGLRVTDGRTLEVVRMVLAGSVNKRLVAELQGEGFAAVGLSGVDGQTLLAELAGGGALGRVGRAPSVNTRLLRTLLEAGFLPVLAPLGLGVDGGTLNINADTCAASLAMALGAERLVFLTDVDGVMDGEGKVVLSVTAGELARLKEQGAVSSGMIPKLEAALEASSGGVVRVEIRGAGDHPGTRVKVETEHVLLV